MERKIHQLVQGTPEWCQFRLEHDGASEAAAMLGLSKKVMRNELLRMKHTGIAKEFSDWVQENILDEGHRVEELARDLVEEIIGAALYPATWSYGLLSASCDGLTADDLIAFEHKQYNQELFAAVQGGNLPDEHQPQCQQVMHVTGAEKLIFVCSDGTRENLAYLWVLPDPAWVKRIDSGWVQFHADLENYQPPEIIPAAVATITMNLPAVSVQVQGSIALISNLDVFGEALKGFIAQIPEKPATDQEFADCKSAIGKLQDAQDALDAAEANALGQIATFDEMRRTKALYFDLARTTRLALEKLVAARETAIKTEEVRRGRDEITKHIAALNARLGKPYMPAVVADFAAAIKNKRTPSSLRNAVDTLLSQKKIEYSAIADAIQINLNSLSELATDYAFLFADAAQIVLKANDDLVMLVKSRIADHKEAEQKRLDAERERIRAEEQAKAEAEAKRKADAEAAAKESIASFPSGSVAEFVAGAMAAAIPSALSVTTSPAPIQRPDAVMLVALADDGKCLKLGEINSALGFTVTSEYLEQIGFPVFETQKNAKLYRFADFPLICQAIIDHVRAIASNTTLKVAA